MAKSRTVFVCQSCAATYPKWQGQCSDCQTWNSLVEEEPVSTSNSKKSLSTAELLKKVISLPEVEPLTGSKARFFTGIGELDRVLGGGIVPGAVTLVGGEPGIGKSTIMTQLIIELLSTQTSNGTTKKTSLQGKILYISGEESPSQIALRIKRLLSKRVKKVSEQLLKSDRVLFVTTTDVDEIAAIIAQQRPGLIIVDSLQTLTTQDLTGSAGSVGQLRTVTDRLTTVAKASHTPLFLIGHVTKDGAIAGPKVLEHIVDTVLEISGERTGQLRLVRAIKNRFGATDEVGVFRIVEEGMEEVINPSELFLDQIEGATPGSVTVCVMEGTRPLLLEVQALVVSSQLAMPRRVGRGIELSRIQVLAAVLQKHSGLPLHSTDIFLSAAGGFKISEPAVDLGLAVAIASSHSNVTLPEKTTFIGEVGLLGEIRSVQYLDRRIKEAKRLGFSKIISRETHSNVREVIRHFKLS